MTTFLFSPFPFAKFDITQSSCFSKCFAIMYINKSLLCFYLLRYRTFISLLLLLLLNFLFADFKRLAKTYLLCPKGSVRLTPVLREPEVYIAWGNHFKNCQVGANDNQSNTRFPFFRIASLILKHSQTSI